MWGSIIKKSVSESSEPWKRKDAYERAVDQWLQILIRIVKCQFDLARLETSWVAPDRVIGSYVLSTFTGQGGSGRVETQLG